jgi:cell division initiation protein
MAKITIVDIQHKEFKKSLQGYDRNEVNEFLDEVIETLEDENQLRTALQGEIADLRERLSHFKAMEESLQSTLLLAQRTADEVKAAAHKEADLIKQEARIAAEREVSTLSSKIDETRRDAQRHQDTAEKAKSELRSLLMSHLSLLERNPAADAAPATASAAAPAESAAPSGPPVGSETDTLETLPLGNGAGPTHKIVQ